MSLFELLILAVALAMDAFAVSVTTAALLPSVTWRHYFRLSFCFGLFQFFMPVIGWMLGLSVRSYIEAWDHWLAFGLLTLVGLNMLREAFSDENEKTDTDRRGDPTSGVTLLVLAVATSVDALAVGLSFAMLGISVWIPSLVIGIVCAALTSLGIALGRILGSTVELGGKASFVGGLVLIGIGVKILYEHGVF